ncbi:unnamed protein product [Cladocopium goreaui]|uniref:Uncharacterized protein n=1 Tax=Cladocopium goreaui TaxID=2562237 RepID=A0A9P1FWC3_9DINO|nr:unnamed protein product [Cladocopium goreaui]
MEACGILWHPAYWVETMQVLVKSLTGKRTKFNVQQRTTIGVVPSILLFTLCGDDEGGEVDQIWHALLLFPRIYNQGLSLKGSLSQQRLLFAENDTCRELYRALGGVAAPEVEAPPDLQPLCLLRGTPKEGGDVPPATRSRTEESEGWCWQSRRRFQLRTAAEVETREAAEMLDWTDLAILWVTFLPCLLDLSSLSALWCCCCEMASLSKSQEAGDALRLRLQPARVWGHGLNLLSLARSLESLDSI